MNAYEKELSKGEQSLVPTIPTQMKGIPLLLGEELEEQVKTFLLGVRSSGGIVNAPIATAVARGIATTCDANLLAENGCPVNVSRDWAKRLLGRMRLVKHKANTSAEKVKAKDFDELKEQFIQDICTIVEFEEVPLTLVINWDQTGIKYVPVSNWTLRQKDQSAPRFVGWTIKTDHSTSCWYIDWDVFTPSIDLYSACLTAVHFPKTWDIMHNDNHWANETTMLR